MPTACIYTVAVVIKEIGDNYYSHQVTRSASDDGAIRCHTVVVVGDWQGTGNVQGRGRDK